VDPQIPRAGGRQPARGRATRLARCAQACGVLCQQHRRRRPDSADAEGAWRNVRRPAHADLSQASLRPVFQGSESAFCRHHRVAAPGIARGSGITSTSRLSFIWLRSARKAPGAQHPRPVPRLTRSSSEWAVRRLMVDLTLTSRGQGAAVQPVKKSVPALVGRALEGVSAGVLADRAPTA